MKENLRSGYHAFPKHDEDDDQSACAADFLIPLNYGSRL